MVQAACNASSIPPRGLRRADFAVRVLCLRAGYLQNSFYKEPSPDLTDANLEKLGALVERHQIISLKGVDLCLWRDTD